ncbi:peptidase S8/S53 domain-containing protein [Parachaetomium inaequale]|uniref:Peptidase S8/S53 domain-containing protein n=1 Tax=Parachaetomium inaequale TaxID=2588326 RepID=A0AAN6P5E1_9PEZI|nr:peptidase S8/S53 domain-containing protein [Parachaetomium inaequale]
MAEDLARNVRKQKTRDARKRSFDELNQLRALLLAGPGRRKVKVVVIDSGFSATWGSIPAPPSIAKSNYRDFVDGQHDVQRDESGHGTLTAHLVSMMLPEAVCELHVARVFRPPPSQQSWGPVEQAIGWAVEKGVDIILMAFGSSHDDDRVKRAINNLPDNMLFVTAAGNVPNFTRFFFPGRTQKNVMCVFAATASNKAAAELNPPPLNRGYNFALLGEPVLPEGIWSELQSATSYVAANAAAFAGLLLYFSWQPLPPGESEPLHLDDYLHEKMNLVFEELSSHHRDQGYE